MHTYTRHTRPIINPHSMRAVGIIQVCDAMGHIRTYTGPSEMAVRMGVAGSARASARDWACTDGA